MTRAAEKKPTKAAIIALAGAPNAGKSTLLNRILGRALSITTPKPQTTQTRILGIGIHGDTQLVFTDTPGIHEPHGRLHDLMVKRARAEIGGADIVCWLIDCTRGVRAIDRRELPRLQSRAAEDDGRQSRSDATTEHDVAYVGERPLIVVLNKVDAISKPKLLPIIRDVAALVPDIEIFPLSARRGDAVEALVDKLRGLAPAGPWLFPADTVTDRPIEFMIAELVREQLFARLRQEMPYRIAVKTDVCEKRKRAHYIEASIYVDADSARKIIIGAGGEGIKAVGIAARHNIEELVGSKVFLKLDVRVKKDWQDDPGFLEELGL